LPFVVVTEDSDASGARTSQTDDGIDRRRFAGAVGPEKAEELSRFDAQRNSVDGREAPIPLHEAIHFDGRSGGGDYGIVLFNRLYRWRRRVAMSSVLSGIPQSLNWVATFFTSNATRRCFTSQPHSRSVKIA
jgi:hypothetical protein